MDADAVLRELVDRQRITATLHRYLRGIDSSEWGLVESCFTETCRYSVGAQLTLHGRGDVVDLLADRRGERGRQLGLSAVELFTHALSNIEIELAGNRARAQSLVIAYVIGHQDGARVMLVRCVRYTDEFARVGDEWLIDERRHALQWAYEAEPTAVRAAR